MEINEGLFGLAKEVVKELNSLSESEKWNLDLSEEYISWVGYCLKHENGLTFHIRHFQKGRENRILVAPSFSHSLYPFRNYNYEEVNATFKIDTTANRIAKRIINELFEPAFIEYLYRSSRKKEHDEYANGALTLKNNILANHTPRFEGMRCNDRQGPHDEALTQYKINFWQKNHDLYGDILVMNGKCNIEIRSVSPRQLEEILNIIGKK